MSNSNLIWIDLEMTGLDPDQHVILEIASVVTDAELNIVAKGPVLAVKHSAETLALMEDWSRTHHTASGLLGRVESSTCTCRQAEKETLAFLSQHCREGRSPLCGNSVWQDRRFLIKYMPALEAFLHYRNIDVSTLKELVQRWYPSVSKFKKSKQHLAMSDIIESIRELGYYRRKVFVD